MDELLYADELPAELLAVSVDNTQLHAEYRRIAAEQAALRRVATLVARGVEPSEVFDAVTNEMCRSVPAECAGLWRYETSGEITRVAAAYLSASAPAKWPVGARTPIAGNILASMVQRTGRPARMDSYENFGGPIAARARDAGVRAAVGVPIIIDGRVWGLAAVGSMRPGPMPADTEARLSRFAELVASAVVAGHREEQTRQLLAEPSQRSNLIDSLLEGRAFDEWSLCEVAGSLRLPINGPFVVAAAQAPTVGDQPLPEIESKLRSLDIFSAWRLLPDLQVGIVHVKSDHKLDSGVCLLSRMTTARVGVSARFDDLRDTPQALRFARISLRGRPEPGLLVSLFDGSILASAAVSAPEVLIKLVAPTIDCFAELSDQERDILFETF